MKRLSALNHLASRLCALLVLLLITAPPAPAWGSRISPPHAPANDPTPPAEPVKLIFVHHSTGGNWLADPNYDQPHGGLGMALRDNNYFVSATNYGWGPDSIGDGTDIPNWPRWFTGPSSGAYLEALYNESGQNVGDFGAWSRLASDPGGENEIIMFKSCFPNSDLYGNPDDPPAPEPNDQYTVSNAKSVYNALLSYFETRQDKLFVVITAPPMAQGEYAEDAQSSEERAANARAFNNWLVNDWLSGYPYYNVAVFDYYNILTSNGSASRVDDPGTNEEPHDAEWDDGNHHRWWNGAIQHVQSVDNNYSAYPTDSNWDSHPTTSGHQKATAEFVPLLNVYYNRWKTSPAAPPPAPTDTPEQEEPPTPTPQEQEAPPTPTPQEQEEQPEPTEAPKVQPLQPSTEAGVIDDMESGDHWMSYGDDAGSTVQSGLDTETAHGGSASLRIEYDITAEGWGDTGRSFESHQDWSAANGISLWLHSDGTGQPVTLMVFAGDLSAPTIFITHWETTAESAGGWAQFAFSWADFALPDWADGSGLTELDPAQVTGLGFNFSPGQGVLWVDDISLATGEIQPPPQEAPIAEPEQAPLEDTPAPVELDAPEEEPTEPDAPSEPEEPEESDESDGGGGFCASPAMLSLAAVGVAWVSKRRR
ncbi:MAG: carbohydrate binding domain-containing protein [Anaerolineae bacterium]|jgi:hypothetical protein